MAIIYTYPEINQVEGEDLLLISDTSLHKRPTRSVTVNDLAAYIGTVVGVVQNLQSVLTVGNTYVSSDGYGTFTLNDITNNNGDIKYVNTDEGWGYALNAEEGLYFTDGAGSSTGFTSINRNRISIGNDNYIGEISSSSITANRTYALPNASGTIALENLSEWYSVTGSRGLGNLVVKIGDYDGSGNGTFLTVDDNDQSMSLTKGNVTKSKFIFNATQDRNYTFPNDSGTLALTSDIPSPGPGGSGTTNYTARWTNASTLGIGTLYDNGTNVGIGINGTYTDPPQRLTVVSDDDIQPVVQFKNIGNGGGLFVRTDSTTRPLLELFSGSSYRFVVTGTGNVGIGTTSPSQKLEVAGDVKLDGDNRHIFFGGNNTFIGERSNSTELELRGGGNITAHTVYIDNTGQIGVGTTSPSEKLEVAGNIVVNGSNDSADGLHLKDRTFVVFSDAGSVVSRFRSSASGIFQFQDGNYNTNVVLNNNGNSYLNGGNVGIGTTSPLSKLNVNGDIKIEGENELYFGSSGSVPLWEIKASGSDLVINDTGSNVGSVLFNNDEGVVLPRLTTTEINAISLPNTGLTVYNTTLNTLCFYNGSSWQKVSHTNM